MANVRRDMDKNSLKKQRGDVAKLKGNSFYGEIIENLSHQERSKFTCDERVNDKARLRSTLFDNLEEIDSDYEIKESRLTVIIKEPYQCAIGVYRLAKM